MGLILASVAAAGNVLGDQWRDYFYCDSLKENVLAVKGQKKVSSGSSNRFGSDNIISNGAIISVADGQCMMIVEQGKIVELCAEPGQYIFDASTEPTIFYGGLRKNIGSVFKNLWKRITFGGETPNDQRVYYFNTKELMGNKYGTPNPVPFRVVDRNIGLDVDITITCFGNFSYKISNPLLFYTNVCGNIENAYYREMIDEQLESEVLTALQPAFSKISDMGIRYSALPGHTFEIVQVLNSVLSEKWSNLRGIEIVSFSISGIKANQEDEKMIKEIQRNAVFRDPKMAAAHLVNAQAEAMQSAAENQKVGPAFAFMGMNLAAQSGGMNAESLYKMSFDNTGMPSQISDPAWTCVCGNRVEGNFCSMCGSKKPIEQKRFCPNCGNELNAEVSIKFCPFCGNELT